MLYQRAGITYKIVYWWVSSTNTYQIIKYLKPNELKRTYKKITCIDFLSFQAKILGLMFNWFLQTSAQGTIRQA
jgi:hypothetical protein